MNKKLRAIKIAVLLPVMLIIGFMIGLLSLKAYERVFGRPIIGFYIYPGFGRDTVRFVLYYVSSNDVAMCHHILFHKTDRNRIRTHEQAISISRARAKDGDRLLVPFIYEYARDISWDKRIRSTAINHLIFMGGTQEVAVVREISARTNDPMAEVAIELLKKYPEGYRCSKEVL